MLGLYHQPYESLEPYKTLGGILCMRSGLCPHQKGRPKEKSLQRWAWRGRDAPELSRVAREGDPAGSPGQSGQKEGRDFQA